MADKQTKGIDLMKKVQEKQAADRQLLIADSDRRLKKTHKHAAM